MKILFFITSLDVGGAERQVLDLAQYLQALGHKVKVAYLMGDGALLSDEISVETIGFHISKSITGLVKSFFLLRRLINEFQPDVLHSHMVHANLLARCVRVVAYVPKLICSAHNTNEGGKLRMLGYRLTHSLADITTNVSYDGVKAFEAQRAVKPGSMLVVSNGIDTDKFQFDEEKRFFIRSKERVLPHEKIVLAVGRLTEAKGYPELLRAFAIVSAKDQNIRLWIIGGGVLKQSLVSLAQSLKISHRVTFYGVRSDVADFYNAADLYVLSSLWEGFGLVVAEAMATERVVVATDCGGVRDVVGNHGILVAPGDVTGLAAAIRSGLDLGQSAARELGKLARLRIVDVFSLETIVMNWIDIYSSDPDVSER
ncbi:glycosyltransferase [Pseudomonas protegens]|uniref:glycosyltransferase n=1 Tax=Pseudomonas protegens TaxID=380021 RepID=UPI002766DFF9|nr:glycosyltransferase [Pseudomonas protegens]MDP9527381.1 glycosyltransferase [Pseudomonas protegens]